jgi:hypothetical protein
MQLRYYICLFLIVLVLSAVGCAGPEVSKVPPPNSLAETIRVESTDLTVTLLKIIGPDDEGTLIENPGWSEYILEIENLSTNPLAIQNVKILNLDGRYEDSASSYEKITAPPDVKVELAGDAAKTAAGVAAGLIIPYGGSIFSLISSAASASSASAKEKAKRDFNLRVLKNVELAPAGKMKGSAFLPNIKAAKALDMNYVLIDTIRRVQIPLPQQVPLSPS